MSSVRPQHKKDYLGFQKKSSNFGNSLEKTETRKTSVMIYDVRDPGKFQVGGGRSKQREHWYGEFICWYWEGMGG